MRPSRYLPIAAVLAVLALAGCGGGGGSTTSSEPATTETKPTPSKAQLIAQGDGICAEVNAAVGSVAASESGVPNEIAQVSTLYSGMVERLKDLGVPKEKEGYDEFIAAAEALGKVEGEVKLAADREDTTALGEAASKAAPALEEFEAQAAIYGFEKCSEGPSAPTAPSAAGGEEEGGVEAEPEAIEEVAPEEVAPEEVAPETGGAGGAGEEVPPEGGGTGAGGGEEGGGSESGGVGPG
jgi:hypothetical protein